MRKFLLKFPILPSYLRSFFLSTSLCHHWLSILNIKMSLERKIKLKTCHSSERNEPMHLANYQRFFLLRISIFHSCDLQSFPKYATNLSELHITWHVTLDDIWQLHRAWRTMQMDIKRAWGDEMEIEMETEIEMEMESRSHFGMMEMEMEGMEMGYPTHMLTACACHEITSSIFLDGLSTFGTILCIGMQIITVFRIVSQLLRPLSSH